MRRVKRLGALELQTPEFALGGQWAPSRNQARLNEHAAPTFGCHATTSIHVKNPLTDKQEVLVVSGGSYEGAEDADLDGEKRRRHRSVVETKIVSIKKLRNKPYDGKNLKHVRRIINQSRNGKRRATLESGALFGGRSARESDGRRASLGSCEKEIVLYFKLGWKIWFWETWEVRSRDGETPGPSRKRR